MRLVGAQLRLFMLQVAVLRNLLIPISRTQSFAESTERAVDELVDVSFKFFHLFPLLIGQDGADPAIELEPFNGKVALDGFDFCRSFAN